MSRDDLLSLIMALKNVYHENLPAACLMLGAKSLTMHYSVLHENGVQVPASLTIGNVTLGKTNSPEAALTLVGMDGVSKVKSITDSQALKYSAMTTLGMIIDDPSKPGEIAALLLR